MCLFLIINVFPAQFLLFFTLRVGHLVTGQDKHAAIPQPSLLQPVFVESIYHLSGLTLEGTHLSGPAIVAALLLFHYDAASFQDPFLKDREEMMRLYVKVQGKHQH